jgi:Protein of unknown function (DUF1499)
MLTIVAVILAILVIATAGTFLVLGPERLWRIVGPPDLGDVVFETLERRGTPNDALACPTGLCRARPDIVSPVFGVGAVELRAAFVRVLGTDTRIEKLAADETRLQERYLQRTPLLGFPDTIVVRFMSAGEGRSTVALYSRSQVGRRDFGANRARLERWLARLATEVPVAP